MDIQRVITLSNNHCMKMIWNELVKARMKSIGITQAVLAEKMEKSQSAIAHWLGGNRKPSIEEIAEILRIVGIDNVVLNSDGLVEYQDSSVANTAEVGKQLTYRRTFPVISFVQAGEWTEAVEPIQASISDEWYETTERTSDQCFWLKVVGDSMISPHGPSFPEGTLVLVDTQKEHQNGSFVVAKLTDVNEATFKKLVVDAGTKFLKPLNPTYPTISINGNCKVIGVVVDAKLKLY
jgi:SOS-response transcriptional repressor LexA